MLLKKAVKFPLILTNHFRQKFFYSYLYKTYQDPVRRVSWTSRQAQEERFRLFTSLADLNNKTIADIGCGVGGLYDFLKRQGLNVDYTGYDIVDGFIVDCKQNYPDANFESTNIALAKPDKKFDYTFSSGIFAYGNRTFFEEMVKVSFDLCTKAYAFNIHVTEHKDFFKISKEDALAYCQSLKPAEAILHDRYMPNDFTVILYKGS